MILSTMIDALLPIRLVGLYPLRDGLSKKEACK